MGKVQLIKTYGKNKVGDVIERDLRICNDLISDKIAILYVEKIETPTVQLNKILNISESLNKILPEIEADIKVKIPKKHKKK